MEAVFVRVVNGTVVFQRGKQVLKVPYAQLSPADQDRIRAQLRREGHEDQLPPAAAGDNTKDDNPAAKPGVDKSHSAPDHASGDEAMRIWTDSDGRTVVAKFEHWSGNEAVPVILQQANGPLIIAFNKFSSADKDYLRGLVAERLSAPKADAGNAISSTTPPRSQPWNRQDGVPTSQPRPAARAYSPPVAAAPTYTPPNMCAAAAAPPAYNPPPRYTPPAYTPHAYAPPQQVATAPAPTFQPPTQIMEEHYRCSKCGHDFGAYRPALGSACPQCGATFGYVRHADGRIEGKPGSPAYEIGEQAGKITGIILGIAAVGWVIKRIASA
jgi:hypothetical protein